jgi:hypothetical protein
VACCNRARHPPIDGSRDADGRSTSVEPVSRSQAPEGPSSAKAASLRVISTRRCSLGVAASRTAGAQCRTARPAFALNNAGKRLASDRCRTYNGRVQRVLQLAAGPRHSPSLPPVPREEEATKRTGIAAPSFGVRHVRLAEVRAQLGRHWKPSEVFVLSF